MQQVKSAKSFRLSRDGWMILFFSVMYLVGVAGHAWDATFPLMLRLTPWILFILGILVFLPVILEGRKGILAWALVVYLITLSLEILGVKTGLVFGSYIYGETLGLSLLGVPLVIGFNWVLVVLGAVLIAGDWLAKPLPASLGAALLCVLFDYILEPLAISPDFDYWQWAGGDIPLQNYAAWFIIAFLAALVYNRWGFKVNTLVPRAYFGIQFLFFLLLRLLLGI